MLIPIIIFSLLNYKYLNMMYKILKRVIINASLYHCNTFSPIMIDGTLQSITKNLHNFTYFARLHQT